MMNEKAPAGAVVVHLECGLTVAALRREHLTFPLAIGPLWFSTAEPERADWLVETSFITHAVATRVPRERRLLLVTEPVGNFTPRYVNQFGILVSPFNVAGYRGIWHQSHAALANWFADRAGESLDYRRLVDLAVPQKQDIVSVVTTRKSVFPGHRLRLRFLRALRDVLGPRLAIYGFGFRVIGDKAEAILPAKYHLVLENTAMPSYWTEKLADAYLGYALPIVAGPPDLDRWFPPESFVPIDLRQPEAAIATVVRVLDGDIYASRLPAIIAARTRLMRDERIGPLVARVIAAHPNNAPRLAAAETITPLPRAPLARRIGREASRLFWRIDEGIRNRLHRDGDASGA